MFLPASDDWEEHVLKGNLAEIWEKVFLRVEHSVAHLVFYLYFV